MGTVAWGHIFVVEYMNIYIKAVFPADLIDSGMLGGTAVFLRVWKTRMESNQVWGFVCFGRPLRGLGMPSD